MTPWRWRLRRWIDAQPRIIAADPLKYPGVMQAWARLVLSRVEALSAEMHKAGPLFQQRAA
jgi:hypothetical protein